MSNLNVMLLGKTGVGKSSLLNYLAGRDIVETGCDAPKTKKGEFNEHQFNSDYLHLNVIDSWGLESDKRNEWLNVIQDEMKRRDDTPEWSDDIHALVYVVNINTGREEEVFEDNIELLLTKISSHIVVVLSNSQNITDEQYRDVYVRLERIRKNIAVKKQDNNISCELVKVNSVETAGFGKTNYAYGKDDLLNTLSKIAWNSLVDFYETKYIDNVRKAISSNLYINPNENIDIRNDRTELCLKGETYDDLDDEDKENCYLGKIIIEMQEEGIIHITQITKAEYLALHVLNRCLFFDGVINEDSSQTILSNVKRHIKFDIRETLENEISQKEENLNTLLLNYLNDTYKNVILPTYRGAITNNNLLTNVKIETNNLNKIDIKQIVNSINFNFAYEGLNIESGFLDIFGLGSYDEQINQFYKTLISETNQIIEGVIMGYNDNLKKILPSVSDNILSQIKNILLASHPLQRR